MKFSDLKVGEWFEWEGKRFMTIEPSLRMNQLCYAVNLATGRMAFPEKATPSIFEIEVEPIFKPSWAERK